MSPANIMFLLLLLLLIEEKFVRGILTITAPVCFVISTAPSIGSPTRNKARSREKKPTDAKRYKCALRWSCSFTRKS